MGWALKGLTACRVVASGIRRPNCGFFYCSLGPWISYRNMCVKASIRYSVKDAALVKGTITKLIIAKAGSNPKPKSPIKLTTDNLAQ